MFKKLAQKLLWISGESDFKKPEIEQALKADLIVDAILGTGFKPPLKGIAQKVDYSYEQGVRLGAGCGLALWRGR